MERERDDEHGEVIKDRKKSFISAPNKFIMKIMLLNPLGWSSFEYFFSISTSPNDMLTKQQQPRLIEP